ncbi:MAG TPA: hypothetical protein VM166_04870 [Gemmatimonadaceae bacterium]|nr:hypothetical protein [Gemmatimonadaceae bacterium]
MDERTDLRFADEGDAELAGVLRELYAPPAEGAYWDALEKRIVSYVDAHRLPAVIPVNWWTDLAAWAAPGLAAAAVIFVAAGLVLSRQSDDLRGTDDLRPTYEAVTEPVSTAALPGAVEVVTAPHDGSSQREATFRYVLSH